MTDQEIQDLRREKWRLNGTPVRTLDDARSFIESNGFSLMLPVVPPVLLPTFVGAQSAGAVGVAQANHPSCTSVLFGLFSSC